MYVKEDPNHLVQSATSLPQPTTSEVTICPAVCQNLLQEGPHERFGGLEGSAEVTKRIHDSLDELNHLSDCWSEGVFEAYGIALCGVFLTRLGLAELHLGTISRLDNR